MKRTRKSERESDGLTKPYVFIVYQSAESALAEAVSKLLSAWGAEPFYCRQELFDREEYRRELREKITRSHLVILILSREFRWSAYCQAEAGTTMALQKPFIPIVVHPVDEVEASLSIAQVLEGCQYIFSTDKKFVANFRALVHKRLASPSTDQLEVIERLKAAASSNAKLLLGSDPDAQKNAEEAAKVLESEIQKLHRSYASHRPSKRLISAWPSLLDSACRESIINNVIESCCSPTGETTILVVGVSLKYSLHIISEALQRLASEANKSGRKSHSLRVTLVHMHEESPILHALNDSLDIAAIRDHFRDGWEQSKAKWQRLSEQAGIELQEPIVRWIDYIPPRVGILIDRTTLYASHCKLKTAASTETHFQLLVGENEYEFFTAKDGSEIDRARAKREIEDFCQVVAALSQASNNTGVTPIWESHTWIDHLKQYVGRCSSKDTIKFISESATKFEELIKFAVRTEAQVEVLVHAKSAKSKAIQRTVDRLVSEIGQLAHEIKVEEFTRPPTFRAVVIGRTAIGIQSYIGRKRSSRSTDKGRSPAIGKLPLCLIVTECLPEFEKLRQSLMEFAG
jgi:TIR domain